MIVTPSRCLQCFPYPFLVHVLIIISDLNIAAFGQEDHNETVANETISSASSTTGADQHSVSRACSDDPDGVIAAAGFSCEEGVSWVGCDFDLSVMGLPAGSIQSSLCPQTCELCVCADDPNGLLSAMGFSCEQSVGWMGCDFDLSAAVGRTFSTHPHLSATYPPSATWRC